MRVSYEWLRSYTGHLPPPARLAELLTMSGSAVESTEEVAGDTTFEIEVTTNRSDCLSHLGVAREAAAVARTTFAAPEINFQEGPTDVARLAGVTILARDLCPRYTARVIEGVRIGESPGWLKRRLESVGLRPVNNVVDVTNFVLFECGQPLHAFDLDRLEGRRIIVRRAKAGETITAIDGSRHALDDQMLVIADQGRPVAVAGVMGGLDTEVGPKTSRVLLESAEFNPVSIRRTSRALNLASDSSCRFERGIDPLGVGWGSRRAAQLIQHLAGGRLAQGVIDVNFQEREEPVVSLRLSRIERLLGVAVPREEVLDILQRLEFGIEEAGPDALRVSVPSFRPDVTREADLIEEVARLFGYDRVPSVPAMRIAASAPGRRDLALRRIRQCLAGAGLFETVTFSLLAPDEVALVPLWVDQPPVMLDDERRGRDNRLRTSLIPSLLAARRTNQDRARVEADLFETAAVYLPLSGKPLPDEPLHLGLVTGGDFRRVKGLVEAVLARTATEGARTWTRFAGPPFEVGQAARLTLDGTTLGYLGVLSAATLDRMGLKRPAAAAELDLEVLIPRAALRGRFTPLPQFPGVDRDLNILVPEDAAWDTVEKAIRSAGPPARQLLESVDFRETYRGRHVPPGKKSVVVSLVFRAADRTLTREEADEAQAAVLAALAAALGAELRKE